MEKFVNHHAPATWHYTVGGIRYIKVGAYGLDDLEFVLDEGECIIEGHKRYASLEEAYTEENRLWSKYEEGDRE